MTQHSDPFQLPSTSNTAEVMELADILDHHHYTLEM